MKNRRVLLAAVLALVGAGMVSAQTPPAPGLFAPAPCVDAADGAPLVVIGDNASATVPRMWFYLGYAYHWATPTPLPSPLLTTSDPADAGVLGAPTTVVLLGQQTIDYGPFNGLAFSTGGWWNADRTVGSEGFSTWSERRARSAFFTDDGAGNPPLFRPIIDPALQAESSLPVAIPDQISGQFLYETRMRINNGDSNMLLNVCRDESRSITGLVGYRLAYIREELRLTQISTALEDGALTFNGDPLLAGDTVTIRDRIETVNRYYVGQLGLRWERYLGRLNVAATTKLGIGWSNQRIFADGRTTLEADGTTVAGGALVQQSYPYRNQREAFVFIPDLGVTARVRIFRRLHATGTYNFYYISSVARPGKYLDRVVDTTQVPTSANFTGTVGTRPTFFENDSDMIFHGLTVGLTWTY